MPQVQVIVNHAFCWRPCFYHRCYYWKSYYGKSGFH